MVNKEVHQLTKNANVTPSTKIPVKFADGVELNYAELSDVAAILPPGGLIDVTEYGAVGDNSTDDFAAIQAALDACVAEDKRGIYLPGDASTIYRISDTLLVETLREIRMEGAKIAPHSTFDWTETWAQLDTRRGLTGSIADPSNWTNDKKSMITNIAAGDLFALSRIFLTDVSVDCLGETDSSGILMNLQQPCRWSGVRVQNHNAFGIKLAGQQAHLEDIVVVGIDPSGSPPATSLSQEGIVLDNAGFMYFYTYNVERCITSVTLEGTTGQANSFINGHYEIQDLDTYTPVCVKASRYLNSYFANIYVSPPGDSFTVFHIPAGSSADQMIIDQVYVNDQLNVGAIIDDDVRGVFLESGAGATGDGFQRDFGRIILPGRPGTVTWPTKRDVLSVIYENNGELMIGGGNRVDNVLKIKGRDNLEGSNIELEAGSTQTGNLISFKDTSGTEIFTVDENGMPVLKNYSNGTRPAANTLKAGSVIWNTDDNAPNYSDGTSWRDAAGVVT